MRIGDINGDTLADIVVTLDDGRLFTYWQGPYGIATDHGDSTPITFGISSVSIGDLNDDGASEIAVLTSNPQVINILNFSMGSYHTIGNFTPGAGPGTIVATDANGDLRTDIVVSSGSSNTLSVWYQHNVRPTASAKCLDPGIREGTRSL